MPELPEVETVRRGLNKLIKNRKIIAIDIRYDKIIIGSPNDFKKQLIGATIVEVSRRAKYLLFHFDNDLTMISHLRMEGKYQVRNQLADFDKHAHVIFYLDDGSYLGYRDVRKFGKMQIVARNQEMQVKSIAALGPEPLTAQYTLESLENGFKKRKKSIKATLLDQHVVSGLGNIYVDEVLWRAKIHPEEPANKVTELQIKALYPIINDEIKQAIAAGGTTVRSYVDATGHTGNFQLQLHVYDQEGQPCERCGTIIEKIKVAGRGTHYCPHCQVLNS
ncbi:bifunctional DNA-formamidopyrimidine glycosylase/DNA-(apurinic or apyrimidinic site) lyase [Bombilactobacillus bombi]|uniref:bifunctional DNA-formamidopyrimidine glycosylase/DNA-(apurinic or apyrimidinic site) lyase n=1 Tax=Bombilactobacillus bombi TaxID=1303590 RepID=UPI0015E6250F|nr:bifunctional DNA-formamidopyrimidine glycosylase/DNA-(apurinic or apyrimidinic site) lyase [Bombilactobacillus bombi]MBA1434571.1 bifunctional DNA-formamidopyrimidine glycosylase/DNA-(apurinic or apyrimidinic site) lyase [Bombilactobacillus bombi]